MAPPEKKKKKREHLPFKMCIKKKTLKYLSYFSQANISPKKMRTAVTLENRKISTRKENIERKSASSWNLRMFCCNVSYQQKEFCTIIEILW